MVVKITCSLSFNTSHRYAETIKDIITARMIKKSDIPYPMALNRHPAIKTEPTIRAPEDNPYATTSKS